MSQRSKEGREIGQKPRPFGVPGCVQGSPGPHRPAQAQAQSWASTSTPTALRTHSGLKLSIQDSQCTQGSQAGRWDPGGQTVKTPSLMLFGSRLSDLGGWLVSAPCVPLNPQPSFCENWRAHQPGRQEAAAMGRWCVRAHLLGTEFSRPRAFGMEGQDRRRGLPPGEVEAMARGGQGDPHGCSQLARELSPSTRG